MNFARKGCRNAFIFLLGLAVALAAAAYVSRNRLILAAQDRLTRSLEEDRVYLDFTLGNDVRINALTLRNLVLYKNSDRKEPAATLDHLSLRISLLASLLAGAPEVVASTHNARLVVFGPEEEVVWDKLTFTYRHQSGIRDLERLHTTSRGLDLNLAAQWDAPKRVGHPAEAAPAPPPSVPAVPGEVLPSSLDLSALPALAQALDYREAGFQPHLSIQAEGKTTTEGPLAWTLSAESRSFPSKNVDLKMDASWTGGEDRSVNLTAATLTQGERKALLRGAYRAPGKVLEIAQFESDLDWPAIVRDLPALDDPFSAIQNVAAPQVTLRGTHHLGHPERSDLAFSVAGWSLDFRRAPDRPLLDIRDLRFEGTLREGSAEIPEFQAAVAGGAVTGEASVSPFSEKPVWRTSFDAQNLSLARLVKPSESFPAEGSVQLSFAGFGSADPETLQGQGRFEISNGRFLDVALLGSLLRFVERFAPDLGAGVSDQVTASFVVKDGVLSTQDLLLEVSASKVAVQGQVDLASRQTSLEARANLRGLLSALTQSLTSGQGLVMEGTGPLDNIEWKLKGVGKGSILSELPAKPESGSSAGAPTAPAGSLKEQLKQQAMDSLLNGSAEDAVGNLLQGIKERRALRKQEPGAGAPPDN